MTRHEAYIDKDWEELGITNLLVARIRDNGATDFSVFLVDLFCLGVKDAVAEPDTTEAALRELVESKLGKENGVAFNPACAKKMIEGAVAYAEKLGFAPHANFRKARKVLSGLDASRCPQEFTYGRDGRPCYVRGMDDTEERVDRVLAVLTARCGADGFDFEDPDADDDLETDALTLREDLMDWLDAEPEEVPRFYEVSGLLTAMLICPTVLSPLKVLGVLWGPEGRLWKEDEDPQEFANLLIDYWNLLNDLIQDAVATDAHPDAPILDIFQADFDDPEVGGLGMAAATRSWAKGFRRATELWPEAWGNALARPDLAPHWEVVDWWADFDVKENRAKMVAAAESDQPRTLNPSVKALAHALRPPGPPPA